jgi:hypothetical protein
MGPTLVKVMNCGSQSEAYAARDRLVAACAGEFMKIEFLCCPARGSFDIVAQTNYDLAVDFDGNPQDPEKGLLDHLVFILAAELVRR